MIGHKQPSIEIHLIVRGAVQGVFFRAATKRHADSLGIKGYVRNVESGAVEICITSGDAEQLIALLKEESPPIRIDSIEKTTQPLSKPSPSFDIRH